MQGDIPDGKNPIESRKIIITSEQRPVVVVKVAKVAIEIGKRGVIGQCQIGLLEQQKT